MMQKVISGTGGMVKPSDFLQFIKTSGVSGRLLSNEMFYYSMEPLIQEMTGGRVGTGTMSAYNNLAQGRSTVRAAKEMMRLGLLDPHMVEYDKIGQVKRIMPGALRGMDEYTSNPYQWMKEVLIPHMAAKGITSDTAVLNEMGAIFGNRTGSNLFSLMFLQQEKIAKNMAISKNALDVNQLLKLAKSSPQGADMALGSAWENLRIATGESIIPIVIPGLLRLAEAFRWLGKWISQHPVRFDWLIKGFAGLSAALLFSGVVLTLKAAFLGLSIVLSPLHTAFAGTITAVSGMTVALGALAAVAAAFSAAYYHNEIAEKIDSTPWGQWIGDKLLAAKNFSFGGSLSGQTGGGRFGPWNSPATTPKANIDVHVRDPYNLARVVTQQQTDSASGPSTSGAGFDQRQSFMPVGVTGSW